MFDIGSYARQYGIVLTANLNIICTGIGISWASPVLVKLSDPENVVLSRPITESEGAWIVSTAFIGGILEVSGAWCDEARHFVQALGRRLISYDSDPRSVSYLTQRIELAIQRGNSASVMALLFLPLLIDNIGRKFTIILLTIPRIISYTLMIFATEVWMVIVGRILMGISDASIVSAVNIYSSEIANKQIRGSLGTLLHFCTSLGILIILSYGPFINFRMLNVVSLCFAISTSLPSFFLPDSPYFLYKKGKIEESKQILIQLRGTKTIAEEEIREYDINLNKKEKIHIKEIIKTKRYIKSIGIAIFLNVMSHLTGYAIITNYLQSLFVASQSNFSPELSSVIVGIIQLLACFGTTIVIDIFGRKPILVFGQIGVAIGFVALGIFFLLVGEEIVGFMNYLPLISMVMIVFSYNLGIGCTIFPLITELLDGKIRVLGVTLGTICGLITITLLVTFFPPLVMSIGETPIFWAFAVTSAVLCIFVAFVVPETNGMSFKEIQDGLDGEKGHCTKL